MRKPEAHKPGHLKKGLPGLPPGKGKGFEPAKRAAVWETIRGPANPWDARRPT